MDTFAPSIADKVELNSLTTITGTNLLRYSQRYDVSGPFIYPYVGATKQKNLYWNTFLSTSTLVPENFTVTPSNIQAPDGTFTAQVLSGSDSFWIDTPIQVNFKNNTFTYSIYVHNSSTCGHIVSVSYIFNIENSPLRQSWGAYFDTTKGTLLDGTTITGDSYCIENAGGGWYRYSITATASAGTPFPDNTVRCEVYYNSDNHTLANNIVVWGSQLETYPVQFEI